jgi:nucleoside-diphosphate-sugar epimerase
MRKILIIGLNSFISKSIIESDNSIIERVSIREKNIDAIDFSKYEVVLNCSIHPNYINNEYDSKYDLDYQLIDKAVDNGCHYVMLSSRKIYGQSEDFIQLNENSPKNPIDNYGKNKLITEQHLTNKYINKNGSVTIVRCSNVFGLEYKRKSFLGFCLNQLKDSGHIHFDISSKIKRDFIPVEYVGQILRLIMEKKPKGIFNLSSNYGLEIGKIPQYLIEGYGSGSFSSNESSINDQFRIDCSKIEKELHLNIGPFDYKKIINEIGKKLCRM